MRCSFSTGGSLQRGDLLHASVESAVLVLMVGVRRVTGWESVGQTCDCSQSCSRIGQSPHQTALSRLACLIAPVQHHCGSAPFSVCCFCQVFSQVSSSTPGLWNDSWFMVTGDEARFLFLILVSFSPFSENISYLSFAGLELVWHKLFIQTWSYYILFQTHF